MLRRGLTWIARSSAMAIACTAIGACVAEDDGTGATDDAIFGGSADTPANDAVVFLSTLTGPGLLGLCTGALVAPNLVLTARHCVSRAVSNGGVSCNQNGQSLDGEHFSTDYVPANISVQIGATTKTEVAKGKQIIRPMTPYICDADVAFIVLDRAVTAVKPLRVRYKTPVTKADTIMSVGYGRNNTNVGPSVRLKRNNVKVLATGPNTSNQGSAVAMREFEVTQSICSGDSGGPAISERTGAVIGVVSRGGDCNNNFGQIYTMTYGYPETFARALAAANTTLVDENDGADGGTDAGMRIEAGVDASTEAGTNDGGTSSDAGAVDDGGADATTTFPGPDEAPEVKKKKTPKEEAPEESEETTPVRRQGCIPSSVATDRTDGPAAVGAVLLGLALLARRRRH